MVKSLNHILYKKKRWVQPKGIVYSNEYDTTIYPPSQAILGACMTFFFQPNTVIKISWLLQAL